MKKIELNNHKLIEFLDEKSNNALSGKENEKIREQDLKNPFGWFINNKKKYDQYISYH